MATAGQCVFSFAVIPGRSFKILFYGGLLAIAACGSANAQTVRTIGPFNVSFYNSTDPADEGGKSSQDWTGAEIEDVASCIAVWASRITNPIPTGPARQLAFVLE